ncbi:MAG: hypothetical protein EBX39_01575 [Actinobacteria bacterium]|nr:hypothetical protein [Actinomycetota bacterium]
MREGTFSILALARPRAIWLTELSRWATSGAVEIDLIRCISIDEVRARLGSLQRFSAVLLDENCIGVDRDLLGSATDLGCASIVITTGIARRDWLALGADATLDAALDREGLLSTLRSIAAPITPPMDAGAVVELHSETPRSTAPLLAVTGSGGTGTTVIALALAQSLPDCALIDAALDASLALAVGDVEIIPGLQELVDAHRTGAPTADELRQGLHRCPRHGFSLLPGLRRHRDWTALRPHAIDAMLSSLRRAYPTVVADIDADVEGEPDTGSFDIADRNALARRITSAADVVVITGRPDLLGLSRMVSTIGNLLAFGIAPDRVIPLVMRSSRCTFTTNEIRRSITKLLTETHPDVAIMSPAVIEPPKDLDLLLLDRSPLPRRFTDQVLDAVPGHLRSRPIESTVDEPVAIIPGSLGIAS